MFILYFIQVWDKAIGAAGESNCRATLTGHEARIWCVVAREGRIYSCGADKTIIVWGAEDALRGVCMLL